MDLPENLSAWQNNGGSGRMNMRVTNCHAARSIVALHTLASKIGFGFSFWRVVAHHSNALYDVMSSAVLRGQCSLPRILNVTLALWRPRY